MSARDWILVLVLLLILVVLIRRIKKEQEATRTFTRDGRRSFESDKARTRSFLHRSER